jgi:hypothetical protein
MNRPNFETCRLEEYQGGEASRVKEDTLSVGGLYTVLFSLTSPRFRRQTMKCPGAVVDIDMQDNGLVYTVRFNLLDSRGEPALLRNNPFYDGYLLARSGHNDTANIGYFREDGNSPARRQPFAEASADEEELPAVPEYELVAA